MEALVGSTTFEVPAFDLIAAVAFDVVPGPLIDELGPFGVILGRRVLAGNLVSTAAAYAFADANAASTCLYATFSRSVTLLWTACFSQWYSPRRAI
jgi:hypothetical protein